MLQACSVGLQLCCWDYIENVDGLRTPFVFRIFILTLTEVLRVGGHDRKGFGEEYWYHFIFFELRWKD